jgi:hypothetical protein
MYWSLAVLLVIQALLYGAGLFWVGWMCGRTVCS